MRSRKKSLMKEILKWLIGIITISLVTFFTIAWFKLFAMLETGEIHISAPMFESQWIVLIWFCLTVAVAIFVSELIFFYCKHHGGFRSLIGLGLTMIAAEGFGLISLVIFKDYGVKTAETYLIIITIMVLIIFWSAIVIGYRVGKNIRNTSDKSIVHTMHGNYIKKDRN